MHNFISNAIIELLRVAISRRWRTGRQSKLNRSLLADFTCICCCLPAVNICSCCLTATSKLIILSLITLNAMAFHFPLFFRAHTECSTPCLVVRRRVHFDATNHCDLLGEQTLLLTAALPYSRCINLIFTSPRFVIKNMSHIVKNVLLAIMSLS